MTTSAKNAAAVASKVRVDDGFIEPTVQASSTVATADMTRGDDGSRIIECRIKVDPTLMTLTESKTSATQWVQVEIGGTRGWKLAMTVKVPVSQLSPTTLASAVARRKEKDAKLAKSKAVAAKQYADDTL
jgi:hypothetical protein